MNLSPSKSRSRLLFVITNREAIIAKNKGEEDKRRAEAQPRMLDAVRNGHTAIPTYNDGDFWHFNVVENFRAYDSRALNGVYELRYSSGRFSVFRGKQRVTGSEGQIGVLLAMVGQGEYMGGQYLKFPWSSLGSYVGRMTARK